jgi:hypothetical protein
MLEPNPPERSGLEPELGGAMRGAAEARTGLEPELGGVLRQRGVSVTAPMLPAILFLSNPTMVGRESCGRMATVKIRFKKRSIPVR